MGNCNGADSRDDGIDNITNRSRSTESSLTPQNEIMSYEDLLHRDYTSNYNMFLLNNMLLTVQFFNNYDNAVKVLSPISKREKAISEFNERMLRDHQKQVIFPDTLFEHVNEQVGFKSPETNGETGPLLPERIYFVNENIEVSPKFEKDDNVYCDIDKIMLRVKLEESDNTGFVKLRQMDRGKSPNSSSTSSESSYNRYADPTPSTSAADDDDEYTEVNMERTKQPITLAPERHIYTTIPNKFLTTMKVKNLKDAPNDEDVNAAELADDTYGKDADDNLFKHDHYLSSRQMFMYFEQKEFPCVIGPALGLTANEISRSKRMMGTVHTECVRDGRNVHYEISMALDTHWPDFCTFLWLRRTPNVVMDLRTKLKYLWPTQSMKDNIMKHKCVLVPRGHIDKRKVNAKSKSIEWEIGFPRVEKYLHTKLEHPPMRAFMFMVLLQKTFIVPKSQDRGIVLDHLRLMLYWELENDYVNWSDTRLGRKMCCILERFLKNLAMQKQLHYFHQNKNIFGNIPSAHLLQAQQAVHEILENPVVHFIYALRNIQYHSDSFYPRFNFRELYNILTEHQVNEPLKPTKSMKVVGRDQWTKEDEWEYQKIKQMERNMKEKEQKRQRKMEQQEKLGTANVQKDWVNLSWQCKMTHEDTLRNRRILMMFISHFVEMGQASIRHGALRQAMTYFDQAYRLNTLLNEKEINQPEANKFNNVIESEQAKCNMLLSMEEERPTAPEVPPLRTSSIRVS